LNEFVITSTGMIDVLLLFTIWMLGSKLSRCKLRPGLSTYLSSRMLLVIRV